MFLGKVVLNWLAVLNIASLGTSQCTKGYYHSAPGNLCSDINECEIFGTCSQLCQNLDGSFKCSCADGFQVSAEDDTKCSLIDSRWSLFYSTSNSEVAHITNFNGNEIESTMNASLPRSSLCIFCAMSVSVKSGSIYWAVFSDTQQGIYSSSLRDNELNVVADTGVGAVNGVSVDWITGNIYYTDSTLGHIAVCRTGSKHPCTIVMKERLPLGEIAVEPNMGIMFWIRNHSDIIRAGMDGSIVTTILSADRSVFVLAIDFFNSRMYFTTNNPDKEIIESCFWDGKDHRKILEVPNTALSRIQVFGDKLFVTDAGRRQILSMDKFTGQNREIYWSDNSTEIGASILLHQSTQPFLRNNPCDTANCSHICVLTPLSDPSLFKCFCPAGMQLEKNFRTCLEIENAQMLYVTLNNSIWTIAVNSIGQNGMSKLVTLPQVVGKITALVYNSETRNIILYDAPNKRFFEYNPLTSQLDMIINDDLVSVVKFSIDTVGENLYWIDQGGNLEVMSLRTKARAVLLTDIANPVDILFVPELRSLYLAYSNNSRGHIVQMLPNGKELKSLVSQDGHITALTYNSIHNTIYWINKGTRTIHRLGHNKYFRFHSSATSSDQIAYTVIHNGRVYWADLMFKQIGFFRLDKFSSRNVNVLHFGGKGSVQPIFTFTNNDWINHKELRENHDCSKKNCSHICLLTEELNHGDCLCPSGLNLARDGKTCRPSVSPSTQWMCDDGSCIYARYVCNKAPDCEDGSDENPELCKDKLAANYSRLHEICPSKMFYCLNGNTIPLRLVCNGLPDCEENEDESSCPAPLGVVGSKGSLIMSETNTVLSTTLAAAGATIMVVFGVTAIILYLWFRRRHSRVIPEKEVNDFLLGVTNALYAETLDESHILETRYDESRYELCEHDFSSEKSKVIGRGNFGLVYKTTMPQFQKEVAVKTVRSNDSKSASVAVRTILREIKIMSFVGDHENIVAFLGACTKHAQNGFVYVVTEFCENGSLLSYLRSCREEGGGAIELHHLYLFCEQIANGMQFLEEKRVIHSDLSARNVLVDASLTCKITDFGLSRTLEKYDIYNKKSAEPMPWPWMAIELF